jgi:hypothetical protein
MPRLPGRRAARPTRPWAVTANAWLLLLEALGFIGLGALYLGPLGARWPLTPDELAAERLTALTGLVFGLLAVLALSAAVGLFRVLPAAWVSAIMVQGCALLLALLLYFSTRPSYVYALMLAGIFMVVYLHQADVQITFRQHVAPLPRPPGDN